MRKIRLLIALAFATGALTSTAARWCHDTEAVGIFYYPSQPSGYEVDIVDFIRTTGDRHFLDPKAPRFLLVDSQKKFALGIGGNVRATTAIDFMGMINTSTNEGFQTAYIPTYSTISPKATANMSAGQSEIFVKMVGHTGKLGPLEVYVSMNFMGENYTPKLRNAYVDFCGFTAGQTWSTFTDLSAIPYTIDYAGPQSYAGYHVPQLRYTRLFAEERYQFAVAAEMPTVEALYGDDNIAQQQGVPNFVGYMQRNWDKGHIRVSGIYRSMNYYNEISTNTERDNGWAVQLSGTSHIGSRLRLFYQGIYGQGAASYINDLANLPVDMVPNPQSKGELQSLPMWGAYGGVKYDLTKTIFTSFTYGYCRLYGDRGFNPANMYRYTQYYAANMFWNITEDCQIGAEYLHGMQKTQNNTFGKANRVNLMVQYSF